MNALMTEQLEHGARTATLDEAVELPRTTTDIADIPGAASFRRLGVVLLICGLVLATNIVLVVALGSTT